MTTIDRQSAFSGTREVAERLRFDVTRLEDYLSAHVAGFAGPIVVSQFKGGQSNPTYLVETPLRRYVLRRKPPGKLLPSAHAVDREHRIISALSAQRFPVAEPVLYCADDTVTGTPLAGIRLPHRLAGEMQAERAPARNEYQNSLRPIFALAGTARSRGRLCR